MPSNPTSVCWVWRNFPQPIQKSTLQYATHQRPPPTAPETQHVTCFQEPHWSRSYIQASHPPIFISQRSTGEAPVSSIQSHLREELQNGSCPVYKHLPQAFNTKEIIQGHGPKKVLLARNLTAELLCSIRLKRQSCLISTTQQLLPLT